MANRKEFLNAVTAMFTSFGHEYNEARIEGYWIGLNDLSDAEINTACGSAIRECQKLPVPFELRKLVGQHVDNEATAIDAWGDVLRALRLGPYKHVDFDDKIINAVIRNLGGWPTVVERFTDSESEKWIRLEFVKTYKFFASSSVNGEAIRPLAGLGQKEVVDGELVDSIPRNVSCSPSRRKIPCRITNSPQHIAIGYNAK